MRIMSRAFMVSAYLVMNDIIKHEFPETGLSGFFRNRKLKSLSFRQTVVNPDCPLDMRRENSGKIKSPLSNKKKVFRFDVFSLFSFVSLLIVEQRKIKDLTLLFSPFVPDNLSEFPLCFQL